MFLKFKCTFLTEVILSPTSTTRQTTTSLSYIPSSYFLGIMANQHTGDDFNSRFIGKELSFYDAHLLEQDSYALRIPLDWYEEKIEETALIRLMHQLTGEEHQKLSDQGIQLKQMREGYFLYEKDTPLILENPKGFLSLKSAYDTKNRCSKEQLMYQYHSLPAGLVWGFMVEIKNQDDKTKQDELAALVKSHLVGERSIGKSRSAQYGRVLIEAFENLVSPFEALTEQEEPTGREQPQTLYFATNACFFNENGLPTANPSAESLGLTEGTICWEKSAIRTRSYAPYNAKRKARDADRWIVEKGSVIVFNSATKYQGSKQIEASAYLNEGFGRVIFNPPFLQKKEMPKPAAKTEEEKKEAKEEAERKQKEIAEFLFKKKFDQATNFISLSPELLNKRKAILGIEEKENVQKEVSEFNIPKRVFNFIEARKDTLDKISSSQWGNLRTLAKAGYSNWNKGGQDMLFDKEFGLISAPKKNAAWPSDLVGELKKEDPKFLIYLASEMSKRIQTKHQEETTA